MALLCTLFRAASLPGCLFSPSPPPLLTLPPAFPRRPLTTPPRMTGDDDSKAVMPVKGSVRNTDEIAIDDDEDEMEEVGAPSRKQQMARMNLQEKAIPAAVPLHPSPYLAQFRYPSLLSLPLSIFFYY
jgi:hypothetical protein